MTSFELSDNVISIWRAWIVLRISSLRLRVRERMRPRFRKGVYLLDRTAGRSICDIRAREFERPPAVVAAARVELRRMVRESEQVSLKKPLEARPCGFEMHLGVFEPSLRAQHVGKPPMDLGIAARERRQEKRLRVAGLALS